MKMALSTELQRSIGEALSVLSSALSVNATTGGHTHNVVEVTGWQNANVLEALAMYLVALRASVIDQAGEICSTLIGNERDFADALLRSVNEIIEQPTDSGESPSEWKSTWRNPWIAEGIWHCCMKAAMEKDDIHSHGTVIAVDLPHISPKDHGLDVTVLYIKEDGTLGMSFVETKAYKNNPNAAISDAVTMFKAIEGGVHDTRLRQMVTSFRSVINDEYKQKLSLSLWKNERTLIPNPHYDASCTTVQWTRRRSAFSTLKAPVIIMPHCVTDFDNFFDAIASKMLNKALEVAAYV
jgi:hypothetical protein